MYGFDSQQLQIARDQVYQILVQQARTYTPITYSDLVERINAITLDLGSDKDRGALGWLLGDVSRDSHEQGIGMLSAIAVLKDSGMPAYGFYELAIDLGYEFDDHGIFWGEQFEKVTAHYSHH